MVTDEVQQTEHRTLNIDRQAIDCSQTTVMIAENNYLVVTYVYIYIIISVQPSRFVFCMVIINCEMYYY